MVHAYFLSGLKALEQKQFVVLVVKQKTLTKTGQRGYT